MSSNLLVLASGSPRRKELLKLLDRPFKVIRPEVVEIQQDGESPAQYVQRLALDKAKAGAVLIDVDAIVLGADTIVVSDNQVLEKPRDEEHFIAMMKALSGRSHIAMTAVAAYFKGHSQVTLAQAEVTFKSLSLAEIKAYWATGEPHDKAGGYGIQGRAAKFVSQLKGSYFAVVGLPLYETEQLIQAVEDQA